MDLQVYILLLSLCFLAGITVSLFKSSMYISYGVQNFEQELIMTTLDFIIMSLTPILNISGSGKVNPAVSSPPLFPSIDRSLITKIDIICMWQSTL